MKKFHQRLRRMYWLNIVHHKKTLQIWLDSPFKPEINCYDITCDWPGSTKGTNFGFLLKGFFFLFFNTLEDRKQMQPNLI